jgi:thioredoxin-related protein
MPSLNRLQVNENLSNLKIFAINISQESKKKVDGFFKDFGIKNFDPYYDAPVTLAKTFSLRGVPTTILINKDGKEFSRIFGSIDFDDKNFIEWLKTYN